jgi:hypothetical protein
MVFCGLGLGLDLGLRVFWDQLNSRRKLYENSKKKNEYCIWVILKLATYTNYYNTQINNEISQQQQTNPKTIPQKNKTNTFSPRIINKFRSFT